MPLPSPNLDTMRFQDIVDDTKRQIGLRCPEWTDHNVSDPGITLLELFAYMTESMVYRLNQVPERMYIKFLDLLGIQLQPPAPARAELRFTLSKPIEDRMDDPRHGLILPARDTVAGTMRTEFEEAVEFATDAPLRLVRPGLKYLIALPVRSNGEAPDGSAAAQTVISRIFMNAGTLLWSAPPATVAADDEPRPNSPVSAGWSIFSEPPQQNDALWLGFDEEVMSNLIELIFECVRSAATGLDEDFPAQVWEAWNAGDARWERLEVVSDTTKGFNGDGSVIIAMPPRLDTSVVSGSRARWIRCRYTTRKGDLPPRPGIPLEDQRDVSVYEKSPQIISVRAQTVGGIAPASNATIVYNEDLGVSDGTPGQVFALRNRPILARRPDERLLVGTQEEPEMWKEVENFAESGPTDKHYVLDSLTGELLLGPQAMGLNGVPRQYGKIPQRGDVLIFSTYRIGGGARGNVRENEIDVLKSSIPYISSVTNPRRAYGGAIMEDIDHAKMRAQQMLRLRDRAVTVEDFEYLAREATSAVGRVKCLPPEAPGEGRDRPGVVRVVLIPNLTTEARVPTPRDLRLPYLTAAQVRAYLDERRLLTTVVEVMEPEYVFVSTDIDLFASPDADPGPVQQAVRESLESFFHPLTGGFDQSGWPFGVKLTLGDLYARIQNVRGIAFFQSAPKLFVSRLANRDEGVLGREEEWRLETGDLLLRPNEVLCTRMHRVQVRPLGRVSEEQ